MNTSKNDRQVNVYIVSDCMGDGWLSEWWIDMKRQG